ncbi:reverse transcriptase (RNA-dependent DNA polymerase) domain-containing protein [Ditylenchus destructor]|uniref:Reverse transcriptase (RNA-dependent DNA polymerase) domain-containing protein n=1 Tax=Ditylenchus destructor TaxID=166010 RepID=A0AAD4MFW4_9BILA|nr:reverse transcriptase (RNA-dependent DNA polymerase) domain-containing protein [Ditylenchus destructor]
MRIRVVHKLNEDCQTDMRREAENFWMHQLVTIYPFGMNDKVDGMDGFATDMNCAMKQNFKHYFSNPVPNVKRRNKFTVDNSTSTNKLTETIQKETPENYKIRDMYQMFKSNKNMETTKLLKEVENTRKDKESLLASKLLAVIKLNRKKHIVTTEKIPIFIKVDFLNSIMEKLGIRNMIHDSKIERMLHLKESNCKVNLVYNLVKNNFLRFSNYNNTLKNLTQNQLVRIMNEECECKNSPEFVDTQYGHIITGNTAVIECPKLRTQIEKGTKHRQDFTLTLSKFRGILYKLGTDLVESIARKSKDRELLKSKTLVTERLISIGESRWFHKIGDQQTVPADNMCHKIDRTTDEKFIVTCVDKAANNFAITCKKFYLMKLSEELGITINNKVISFSGNDTYELSTKDTTTIFSEYERVYRERKITANTEKLNIPLIFAIPKFHKVPIKYRFIAGAKTAISKPLNITIVRILEVVKNYIRNYCNQTKNRSGWNTYWSVNSSSIVANNLRNRKPRSDTLFCADFSNLFTSLPHEDIIDAIMYLTTRTFEAQFGKKEIHCNQYRAFFSHQYHKNYTPYTLYEVKYMVEFLIKNSYVRFADRNFVQIKGVPQGGNASPLLADLMLTAMEIKYLGTCDNLVKRELSVSFRYIDDLFSLNENIKNHTAAIYGNVLELNRTDNRNGTAFLDLDIKLCNEKIEIKTTRNSVIAMESTGQAQNTPLVDPPQSSAVHDNVEQPMEEVDGAEVNDTTLNANRRACFVSLDLLVFLDLFMLKTGFFMFC